MKRLYLPILGINLRPSLNFFLFRRITSEQLKHAMAGVEEGEWELFLKDGEMRMFKMEKELDGIMMDPLKAIHSVKVGFILKASHKTSFRI
jgi:hypothetical protein